VFLCSVCWLLVIAIIVPSSHTRYEEIQSHFVFLCSMRRLLVTANVVPSSPSPVTLMTVALISSKTSILTRAIQSNIPDDTILHSHHREHLLSYIALTGWTLKSIRNVSPVKYKLSFYIPEDNILHSRHRENLKSYILVDMFQVSEVETVQMLFILPNVTI
jgi:hypothetical protein